MKIIIAGSGGFIGSRLVEYFDRQGHDLVLLSRKPKSARMHYWNPEASEIDASILEGADVVINLCGENVFGRWNEKKKEAIRESRIHTTRFLCNTLATLKMLPSLYINASATGYYGDRPGEVLTESSPPGRDFLAEVCQEWEAGTVSLTQKKVRVVLSRFGIVLGNGGGALKHLEKVFQMGMGGTLGSGNQMMSWISIDDLCQGMQHVIDHPELAGPVNFVSPKAISNLDFTKTLGEVLNRPSVVPVPKFVLSMMLGEGAEIFLASTAVVPQRLLDSGYQFKYSDLSETLKKYLLINV